MFGRNEQNTKARDENDKKKMLKTKDKRNKQIIIYDIFLFLACHKMLSINQIILENIKDEKKKLSLKLQTN